MYRIVATLLLFLVGTALLLFVSMYNFTDPELTIWAIAILWLNVVPILHYFVLGYKNELFPYISLVGFFITLSYSLPVFFIEPTSYEVAPLSKQALEYAFWGYGAFYFWYFSFSRILDFKKVFEIITIPSTDNRIRFLAFFFLIVYLVSTRFHTLSSLDFIGSAGIYIYLGTYLYIIETRTKSSRLERVCFYSILMYVTLAELMSGAVATFALLCVYLSIIFLITGRKFGKVIAVSIIFLIFYHFFAPIKYRYRERVWFSDRVYSFSEKIQLLKALMTDEKNYRRSEINSRARDRLNLLWRPSYDASALSLVVNKTPCQVPYFKGETYIILPKIVPRMFWPNKPKEEASLKFAKAYGLISPSTQVSPYPLPILAEMYMNFGDLGIAAGMLVLALLYYFLNAFFNSKKIKGMSRIYSIAIVFAFIYHEGNLTMTFGNVPLLTLSIFLICRFFQLPYFENIFKFRRRSYFYDGYYPYWCESSQPFKEEKCDVKEEKELKVG